MGDQQPVYAVLDPEVEPEPISPPASPGSNDVPNNNSNSNTQPGHSQLHSYYHLQVHDASDEDNPYEEVIQNNTQVRTTVADHEFDSTVTNDDTSGDDSGGVNSSEDSYHTQKVADIITKLQDRPMCPPPRIVGAVGTPIIPGTTRIPPIGAESSSDYDPGWESPRMLPTRKGPSVRGYGYDEGYTISPSHLASRFDALECDRGDGTFYDDVQFDEDEHGFFIDDDLYDDIIGVQDDDFLAPEESDSSWGSEEWDAYSDESDTDDMIHNYVDPSEPSSRGAVEHGGSGHGRTFVSVCGIDRPPGKEEPKSYLEWVKMLREKSSSLDLVRSFLFRKNLTNSTAEEDQDELGKDDIQYVDVKISTIKHPPPTLPPQPDWLTSEEIARRHVIQAIVDSERSYMMSLQKLIQNYEKPLLESNILEKEKVKTIFYRVRGIYQCHVMFQIALASRVMNWDEMQQIGDVFVASFSKAMVLDVYSAYVNNFTHAMETAKRAAAQKTAFQEFLMKHQSASNDRLSLYALMLKPIQRFPQFICLLQDLLKRTHLNHPDRMPLQLALTKLETLAGVLNERKRQSEQRHAVKQLIRNINAKFSNKGNERQRWLVKQEDMLQTWYQNNWSNARGVNIRLHTYDNHGEELKCKERRLFMLNDLLVCTTPVTNSTSGMDAPRYKHRWSVPLTDVEVVEPSVEGGELEITKEPGKMTITTQHMDENEYLYGGSTRQLYQERNDLMHDLAVVKQLGATLLTLKGTYGVLTNDDIEEWGQIIQKLIKKKGQEIKQADVSKIQLSLPSVNLHERVTIVFDAVSPKIKVDWCTALETAKLGLRPSNNPGWYAPDESDSTLAEMNFGVPLHMKTLPIFVTEEQCKIQCSVLIPPEKFTFSTRKRSFPENTASKSFLWLCSSSVKKTIVTIIGFQPTQVMETFEIEEKYVLCMEYVPGHSWDLPLNESMKKRENFFKGPTVWMGCKTGRICVYEIRQPDKTHYTASFLVSHPITCLQYLYNRLFAALGNGTVLIYERAHDGQWLVNEPREIKLSTAAVTCLLPVQNTVWCGSGNFIYVIDPENDYRMTNFEAHHDERQNVRQFVIAGIGVWVAFTASDTIRLFHVETLQVLQDISVGSPIGRMISSLNTKQKSLLYVLSPVYVTTFLASHGSLWVGTNTGIIVSFPLPRLEGIPLVNGPAMVSYHTHYSPIRFLKALDINQQNDRILYSSTEEDIEGEASSLVLSPASKTAETISSAMSPMTDYFSLTPHDTESKPLPGEIDFVEEPPKSPTSTQQKPSAATSDTEQVSASITSTTSLIISGGEGHNYLMGDMKDGYSKESNLLIWQVST